MEEDCVEYIYSNEYAEFTVDYQYDINNLVDRFNPICINQITRKYFTVYKKIDNIFELPITEYGYNTFPKLYGLLDMTVLEEMGVNRLKRIPAFDLDGTDVLIGFVDTGINYTLDIFKFDEYSTRVVSIWDQTTYESKDTSYARFGRIYTRDEINRAIVSDNPYDIVKQRDEIGHGTVMAAVAAGSLDEKNDFMGIASNCEIVVVKLKQAKEYLKEYYKIEDVGICYQDNDIMVGIQYLLDEANRLNKPIVICLGVGSNMGSHDGRDNLSQYIDDFSNNAGIAVIVAGGNEVASRHHYKGNMELYNDMSAFGSYESDERKKDSNIDSVQINVGNNIEGFSLEMWIEAPNRASIAIRSPMGEDTGIIQMRTNRNEKLDFLFDRTQIYINMKSVEESTGNALIFIRFITPSSGIWQLDIYKEIQLEGKYGIWLPLNGLVSDNVYFIEANPDTTLVSIGNSAYSICIGGYDTDSGGIYTNSSRGYTFDDRIKPDIVAPAVDIYSPDVYGNYTRHTGTSIASACGAGVAVLLFQWADSVILFLSILMYFYILKISGSKILLKILRKHWKNKGKWCQKLYTKFDRNGKILYNFR